MSCRSEASFDSNFSDGFPAEQKKTEAKIKELKKLFNDDQVWSNLVTAFKILAEKRERDSKYLSLFYITQESIRANWKLLFKHDCDILARVIYIKLSQRKFRARVNFHTFASAFLGLMDESAERRNKCVFNLMEFNGDGEFDVMYLF